MHPIRRPRDLRRWLITILDSVVIVLGSAVVVIALGGRTQIALLGVHVGLHDGWRPALLALGALGIRQGLGRSLRPLPAIANPTSWAALHIEKARFAASPPRQSRLFWIHAAAAMVASLVWLTPHLLRPRAVPDSGDPIFSAWRLAAFAHQLAHAPRHLFDGRIFYPTADTLTYSDATVLEGLVAAPFLLAGFDPLLVSNLLFLAAFPLNALAFFYAGWRLTGDERAALMSGILGALYPFHWEHYSHLELQFTGFIPLAIVALLAVLAAPTPRRGWVLGLAITAQWLACMYFGVMLLAFLVPFAIVMAVAWRVRPDRALLRVVSGALIVIVLGFAGLGSAYMRSRAERGDRAYGAVTFYSATADDYGHAHIRLASYQWITREHNHPERELFPGIITPGLAAIAAFPPAGAVAIACLASGALAFDWSLGANGLMYDELYRYLLPFRGMRVPARFSAFVGCALVLLAAYGSARLFRRVRDGRRRGALAAVLAAAALVDLRSTLQLEDYWTSVPPIYASLTPEAVLAEFPLDHATDYMYFAAQHHAALVNGSSGFSPDRYIALEERLRDFPSRRALDVLRRAGATYITVNCRFYGPECPRVINELDAADGVQLVASALWERAEVRLYSLLPDR